MVAREMVERFLDAPHLAVVGASDNQNNFGRTVYQALRDHGHQVVAINPEGRDVAGDRAYADLGSVPWPVESVLVMTSADAAPEVVRGCARHGVQHVWLFKGLAGSGAASPEAIALCGELGMDVVDGACPLMFLEPVGFAHRLHRKVRELRGAVAA
jgi:predicted CoA-binding protein